MLVLLDLHAEVAVTLRYAIEPMGQHPHIFAACDRIWIDLILDVRSPLRRAHDIRYIPKDHALELRRVMILRAVSIIFKCRTVNYSALSYET